MEKIRRAGSLLLAFGMLINLFLISAAASERRQAELEEQYAFAEQSLEEILTQFREEYGLTEENFSLSYHAPGIGETYHFAEHTYRTAGSMYKLALNMYYYDLEREGELDPETVIQEHRKPDDESEEPLKEWALSQMHYDTIVHSDNDMAIAMLYNLGSFYEYRVLMSRYSEQKYSVDYYWNNVINSNYMLDVLKYLYDNQELYPELMENLKKAAPWMFFKQYVDYPIAHKYGMFEGAYCDAGIIFSDVPFFLVAMVQTPYEEETEEDTAIEEPEEVLPEIDGPEVVARVCELLSAYTDYMAALQQTPEAEEPLPVLKPLQPRKLKPEIYNPFRYACCI